MQRQAHAGSLGHHHQALPPHGVRKPEVVGRRSVDMRRDGPRVRQPAGRLLHRRQAACGGHARHDAQVDRDARLIELPGDRRRHEVVAVLVHRAGLPEGLRVPLEPNVDAVSHPVRVAGVRHPASLPPPAVWMKTELVARALQLTQLSLVVVSQPRRGPVDLGDLRINAQTPGEGSGLTRPGREPVPQGGHERKQLLEARPRLWSAPFECPSIRLDIEAQDHRDRVHLGYL